MIHGIGIDLVAVERMKRSFTRFGDRLARKILSEVELREFAMQKTPVFYLAKHFAAKEAVVKALGTGFSHGILMKQITVSHAGSGRPVLEYHGVIREMIAGRGIQHSFLTLTDENDYACACVVLEK